MKQNEVIVGTLVALREEDDAKIYRVNLINDDGIHLEYWLLNGAMAHGGVIHWSLARKPTVGQIANRIQEISEWWDANPEFEGNIALSPVWAEYKMLRFALEKLQ